METGPIHGSRCPTCGSSVLIVRGDEGTSHFEPFPIAAQVKITDEMVKRAMDAYMEHDASRNVVAMRAALEAGWR